MILLTSRWELLAGCPPALKAELDGLPERIRQDEPETLLYQVNLQAPAPLGADGAPIEPPPPPIPLDKQQYVTFMEMYADAQAFSRHIHGPIFQRFLQDFGHCFRQDPAKPGWPITQNNTYLPLSGFHRPATT
ncbi:hypothetical protein HNQ59_003789 [Chitinivorax tropicus]|uniref:ABM domain-containing protein n=1 Tax=Chitinivorax tropicus TaxID=714531 RepID=A0A840MTQ8_9PROT|nr:hypothetical protein [Chitinivorax tropicus]MBB5020469.1 hypothetical protein [Chitinivorax tropicus]